MFCISMVSKCVVVEFFIVFVFCIKFNGVVIFVYIFDYIVVGEGIGVYVFILFILIGIYIDEYFFGFIFYGCYGFFLS